MKKKGVTERVSPRHGIDRLKTLRKRETNAKAWDRLPAKDIHGEHENATQSGQIP